jgi:superfamily I DNA/RNA helicase
VDIPAPIRDRLARLAPDQRSAATTAPGPVLCVAPAGSGKTTTLVARIAWRVAHGVDPAGICALTFNRRAAEELQERADMALGEVGLAPGSVRVRTFHALGRAILADAGVDVARVVERHEMLAHLAGGPLPADALRWLDDAFTRLKLDPERGPPPEDIATHEAFMEYQAGLARRGALDLDDLVARALPTLVDDAALLRRWRGRASVLFVDEAQDLDRTQLELAELLAGERRDIFLVGDDDQTIYAWRLADVRRVLGLAARLPGLRRVDLETNHRCAPEIVRRAARLVAHNQERFDKVIRWSPATQGSVLLLPDSGDEVTRARLLLTDWPQDGPDDGPRDPSRGTQTPVPSSSPGSRAILARTNAELVPYAAVALELGLPYRVDEDGLLLDTPELLEVVATACTRTPRGEPPLLALAASARDSGLDARLTAALLSWAAPCTELGALRRELEERLERRSRLAGAEGALTLATFHGTKGLEWDHVVCVGHDEGIFPAARALREAADPQRVLEEERRLAYVAWTRARRTLTIVYDPGAPSMFLREAFDRDELA